VIVANGHLYINDSAPPTHPADHPHLPLPTPISTDSPTDNDCYSSFDCLRSWPTHRGG
jgi:hypothetical protein